jgi:hypothetical protein
MQNFRQCHIIINSNIPKKKSIEKKGYRGTCLVPGAWYTAPKAQSPLNRQGNKES